MDRALTARTSPPGVLGFQARSLAPVLAINLLGGGILFFYFSVIDVSSLSRVRFIVNWETLLILTAPAILAALFSWRYSRPLFEYFRVVTRPGFAPLAEQDGGGRIIHLRRRALRFPLVSSLASVVSWVLIGLLIAARLWATGRALGLPESLPVSPAAGGANAVLSEGLYQSGATLQNYWQFLVQSVKLVGLSAVIGGMLSAAMFFVIETVWQKELPRFFPAGRISAVGDRWLIPVRYRLIAIFVMVGTVPLILIGVLSYQRAATMLSLPPEEVLGNLLLFNLFMVLTGVGLAVLLSSFVARSVSEPLDRLREAMERVKAGYLWLQVPVRANDELGRVTEGFNDMLRALGEKETSIQELTQGLEDKVVERTQELSQVLAEKERTQSQLIQSEKMASLGQLVAGVAHEINNPVGYIYANTDHLERYLERLREAFVKNDPAQFQEAAQTIERLIVSTREGAKRAKDIVQGLRTFSRRDPALRKPLDIHEALETSLMLLGHELKRGINVVRDYHDLPPITANAGELSQVFMNIIVNAVQAMGEAGELRIETRRRGDRVAVRVSDTGGGISEEHLAHIFEPFFTTKDVGQGTGLGLAIAYGIVKAHGGEIKVESEPGRGTRMEVILPLNPAAKVADP